MDLIQRCLDSEKAIICGSGCEESMLCRSMIDVCIPRVLKTRALRLWCVKTGFVEGNIGRGVMWGCRGLVV
jgi:hypothetical protein